MKILKDRATSHSAPTLATTDKDLFTLTLKASEPIPGVAVYIPAVVGKPNTEWLRSQGVLDAENGKVVVDEFLRCKNNKILAVRRAAAARDLRGAERARNRSALTPARSFLTPSLRCSFCCALRFRSAGAQT